MRLLAASTRATLDCHVERALRRRYGAGGNLRQAVRRAVLEMVTRGASDEAIRTLLKLAVEDHPGNRPWPGAGRGGAHRQHVAVHSPRRRKPMRRGFCGHAQAGRARVACLTWLPTRRGAGKLQTDVVGVRWYHSCGLGE